ncbi:ankyrin repeat domain-containing protein SOWAHC isoform X2 [Myripristis murdjan]|uniref:ankyrin repeat domain-containing protein SOWAHC isoform X2 n=1 Tax=Myripristis murdjan TaxID=586833 RepID=UPI001175CB6B|nr:ankyrin repeat domain-containing protein SOWAHC-like isoform X2 [Myripristis murdjan]
MSDVSEESLLDYFYSSGGNSGKVKNADILKTYKPFIGHSDLQLRAKYREEFKLIIDRIAVVKSENGEKYLVLKKKYRQLLQERDTGDYGTNRDGQRQPSPAGVQVEEMDVSSQKEQQDVPTEEGRPGQVMWCGGSSIASESTDQTHSQEDSGRTATTKETPVIQIEEHCIGEDELDKDSGSKSESEQDEEGTGSMGSTAVALDPIEKEWIYSAACARVPDLSQLLRQDPSLANKKDFTSGFTALHWAAKHGREDMATLVVDAGADVNTKSHGGYTPLHIAALHGHRHILDLLIGTYGAKENLRDYSGHLACHYLNIRQPEGPEEDSELQYQATQARERNRNRKLTSLFQSKKKWGSAEDLAPIEEERAAPHQLILPAFRPRKFSR